MGIVKFSLILEYILPLVKINQILFYENLFHLLFDIQDKDEATSTKKVEKLFFMEVLFQSF